MIPSRPVLLAMRSADDQLVKVPMLSVDMALDIANELAGTPLVPVYMRTARTYGWKLYDGTDQFAAIIVIGSPPDLN